MLDDWNPKIPKSPATPFSSVSTPPTSQSDEALKEALLQHNDLLRSACSIADRDGRDTNWLTFRGACHYTLAEHHDLVTKVRANLNPDCSEFRADKSEKFSQSDEALVVEIASILDHPSLYMGGPSWGSKIKAKRILPIIAAREAAARAGVLHIGTMKVWRGQTPGTIFIQQGDGEGGEFPEADLEAIWQSYYAENF